MSRLGGCEGYEVKDDWIERRAGQPRWIARLEPVRGSLRECGGCGERTPTIHDLPWRRVRDLPAFDRRVELRVARVRVACPVRPEARAAARVTQRLAESVGQLCEAMAVRHVARYFDLDWQTVKRLDRQRLERTLGPADLDGIEVIAMDEFAIQKGHRYATQ